MKPDDTNVESNDTRVDAASDFNGSSSSLTLETLESFSVNHEDIAIVDTPPRPQLKCRELRFPAQQLDELFYVSEQSCLNDDDNIVISDETDIEHGEGTGEAQTNTPQIDETEERPNSTLQKDLPATITSMTDKMKQLPQTIRTFTKRTVSRGSQVVVTAQRTSVGAIRTIADLPNRASPTWKGNLMTFAVLVTIPSLINLTPYFVGSLLRPVDDGYGSNKNFVWGYKIPFEAMQIYPFIELCNQAMPLVEINIRSRLITLIISIFLVKAFQYFIWVRGAFTGGQDVFPFPLSPVSTSFLGSVPIVPLLYVLSSQQRKHHFKILRMIAVIATLWLTAFLGLVWAVGIVHTKHSVAWQNVVAGLFGLVVYVCRIEVGSKTTKNVSTDRWPQINATGNIILFNFQFFAYPYIRGPIQLVILLMSQIVANHWKIWAIADRLMTAGRRLRALYKARQENEISSQQIPGALWSISYDLVGESHFEAIEAKQVEHGELVRSMTSETLNLSFSNGEGYDDPTEIHNDVLTTSDPNPAEIDLAEVIDYDSEDDEDGGMESNVNSIFRRNVESIPDLESEIDSNTTDTSPPPLSSTPSSSSSSTNSLNARHPSVQRYIYLLMEAINTVVIYIITRSQQEIENILLSTFAPASSNLTDFRIPISRTSDDFLRTQIYGWSSIVFMILVLMYLGWRIQGRVQIFHRTENLTMAKVLAYSFSKNFWLYFWWLTAMSLSANMGAIKHWGMDYSFHFKYFDCLDDTEWPACPN